MNKQKIRIGYVLSKKALKNYFLAGNKQEKKGTIEIETDDQFIIDQAILVNNEYLGISRIYKKNIVIRAWHYFNSYQDGWIDTYYDYSEEDFLETDRKIIKAKPILYDENIEFDSIPTEKEIEEVFDFNKILSLQIEKIILKREKEMVANSAELARLKKEEEEAKEEEAKEEEAKEEEKKKMINTYVDEFGSEILKLRKELQYDYEGLAIQEKCDSIEFLDYEKIEDSNEIKGIKEISKPCLKLMKLIKSVKEKDFVLSAFLELWEDQYNYKYEVIKITYQVFNETVTRKYIIS